MKAAISAQVVRGNAHFAEACRVAAAGLAMLAAANAMAPEVAGESAGKSPRAADPFNRAAVSETPAALKLKPLLADQQREAQPVSAEQAKTLGYGIYPPVKTALQIGGKLKTYWTLHPFDLVRLTRQASNRAAELEGERVSPERIGAVMITESSLVARNGLSANGKTPSYGLGQLEANTAQALGVKDPNDPVEAAVAVARLLAQGQKLAKQHRHIDEKLVISLSYNTSTTLRKSLIRQYGPSLTIEKLPLPTQHHVKNMAYGQQLMASFSRLADLHESQVAAATQTQSSQSSSVNLKENLVNTSHSPRPTTRTLFAGQASDADNQIRLAYNQKALEKAGHLQPLPMTSKGLETMRQAVSAFVQRATDAKSPAAAPSAPLGLLSKASAEVQRMAAALSASVAANLPAMSKAVASAKVDADGGRTAGVMQKAKDAGFVYMGMAKVSVQAMREMQLARQRDAQRPA